MNQASPAEIKENSVTNQEDVEMGPWNIPEYVTRKRKNNHGKTSKKVSEGSTPIDTSIRGQTKVHPEPIKVNMKVEHDVQLESMEQQNGIVPAIQPDHTIKNTIKT